MELRNYILTVTHFVVSRIQVARSERKLPLILIVERNVCYLNFWILLFIDL